MIDKLANIDRAAIQSMTSARADSIYLHYANTDDVCYNAGQMIADHIGQICRYPNNSEGAKQLSDDCTRTLDRSTITAYIVLQPSHIQPRAGFAIDVDTPDGQRLHRKIYAPSGSEAAAEIISRFLSAGAPGLHADVRQRYERQHRAFMRRAILSGGAGLKPELREFCKAFASAVRAGMAPEQIIAAITD